jgi:hypothetical protein
VRLPIGKVVRMDAHNFDELKSEGNCSLEHNICARMIAAKTPVKTATATSANANGTISGIAMTVRRLSSSSPGSGPLTNNLRLFGRREACGGSLRWKRAEETCVIK